MKPDTDEIIAFIDKLGKEGWLGSVRSRWTKYVFHHTDIHNALAILRSGKLLCRSELERTGQMPVDNASRAIISSTHSDVKDFVRLYFRPRTPTQYRNEGLRPKNKQWVESHCPVPIFFLFDSKSILTRSDCFYSEGNLATVGIQGLRSSAKDLASFDFKKIYHDSPHNDNNITFHKNAEVVIRNELNLSSLKLIVCRTPAEKDTLLNLLPANIFRQWAPRIIIDTKANFFFRKWTFVQKVELTTKYVTIDFSPDTKEASPFLLTIRLKNNREKVFERADFCANNKFIFRFPEELFVYDIEIELDNNLVHYGKFNSYEDVPF
jgi:ssDNA thymidine ADP-ribosyltransferase, DarT